ncbi:MAG: SDR family oxidoreductase [Alphaproteobacteria bacterium]|nr:SDR family oxidoreductase [Alphaproteobacteria bacterium]
MTVHSGSPSPQKCALVTGAARRVGAAITKKLAASGYHVACHVRQPGPDADALIAEIQAAGGVAAFFEADLTDAQSRSDLMKRVGERFGRLDLLVNNAAVFKSDSFDDFSENALDAHLAINLKAPIDLARHFSQMASANDPSIINIVDHRVLKLTPQHFTYTLSKAALHTATQTMAQALAPRIRVNAIGPGPTLPNQHEGQAGFLHEAAGVPLQHSVDAEDIAQAVLYLASARSVTGVLLPVDAGQAIGWKTPDIVL